MKVAIATAIICIAAGIAWYALRSDDAPRSEAPRRAVSVQSEAPLPAVTSEQAATSESLEPAPVDDPVEVQEQRLAFHARVRTFFAQAPAMEAADRQKMAASLDTEIAGYERRGELSAGEALLLRSALVRESVSDSRAQAEQIAALERRYQDASEQRRAASAAQRDPMFELYKLREAAIVSNVMAMEEIPDGLSRNEYLRRRLQAERELLFDGG